MTNLECGCKTREQAEMWSIITGLIVAAAVMLLLEIWKGLR